MIFDFEPGDKVFNPKNKAWGIGQIQSIINDKVTVNFQNVGKKVINAKNIELEKINEQKLYTKSCRKFNRSIFKRWKNFFSIKRQRSSKTYKR